MLAVREDGSMQQQTEGARILGFDGLRAIAFTLVFLSHKITFADAGPFGHVGVWLFFVLSGFLITRILADERTRIEQGSAPRCGEACGASTSAARPEFSRPTTCC